MGDPSLYIDWFEVHYGSFSPRLFISSLHDDDDDTKNLCTDRCFKCFAEKFLFKNSFSSDLLYAGFLITLLLYQCYLVIDSLMKQCELY
jgi:hypothetical protein